MTTAQMEKRRKELRREYQALPKTADKLAWCNANARSLSMSYGQFVAWLGV